MWNKHKILNESFRTFFMHILAQRRRHTNVSSFTVNLWTFLSRQL